MSNSPAGSAHVVATSIGLCLMLVGFSMYRFFGTGVFVALPFFSLGSALAGASLLIGCRGRHDTARLASGWLLVVLSLSPIALVVLFFNDWVGP